MKLDTLTSYNPTMERTLEKSFTEDLLNKGHSLEAILKRKTKCQGRILYISMYNRNNKSVKSLLDSERPCFNVNSLLQGKTLAHIAVLTNNPEGIELLSEYCADFNTPDVEGKTPLHYACRDKKREVVRTLLRLGADINACDVNVELLPSWHPIYFRFIEHIACLHCAGMFVQDKYLAFLMSRNSEKDLELQCADEIINMKKSMVSNAVSFYRLMHCSEDSLARYILNPKMRKALKSAEYDVLFPLYSNLLWCKIQKGFLRRQMTDESMKTLSLLPPFSLLPWGCLECIISFLSNEELGILNGHYYRRVEI